MPKTYIFVFSLTTTLSYTYICVNDGLSIGTYIQYGDTFMFDIYENIYVLCWYVYSLWVKLRYWSVYIILFYKHKIKKIHSNKMENLETFKWNKISFLLFSFHFLRHKIAKVKLVIIQILWCIFSCYQFNYCIFF